MQQLFFAMLAAGALLIARDMAKSVLGKRGQLWVREVPQDRDIQLKAEAFHSLADAFYELPPTGSIREGQTEKQIWDRFYKKNCRDCGYLAACEQSGMQRRQACIEEMARLLSDGQREQFESHMGEWLGFCSRGRETAGILELCVREHYRENFWRQRMVDVRLSSAMQLREISHMMRQTAREIKQFQPLTENQMKRLRGYAYRHGLVTGQAWLCEQGDHRIRLFVSMRTKNGRTVSTQDIARALSGLMSRKLVPEKNQKLFAGEKYQLFAFTEDVSYELLYGVSRRMKDGETVCGDSYGVLQGQGQTFLCLSDGMGSGPMAKQTSEHVLNLLEELVECGFTKETAFHMINTAALIKCDDESYATMDICQVNLYTGMCEFLKAGACASFIFREQYVECVSLPGMAPGLQMQSDYEKTRKKLFPGNYVVMVTDGVLEALPPERQTSLMQEIILHTTGGTPAELSRRILEKVLNLCQFGAADDMTVLVAGMWQK